MRGRFAEAHRAFDDAFALVEKNDERFQEAELHRLRGELCLAESNDAAAAATYFQQAIEIARKQQSRAWELRAAASLARLWHQQGTPPGAAFVLLLLIPPSTPFAKVCLQYSRSSRSLRTAHGTQQ